MKTTILTDCGSPPKTAHLPDRSSGL